MNEKKNATANEPLIHLSKRESISIVKSWLIRLAAIVLGLVVCGLVAYILSDKLRSGKKTIFDFYHSFLVKGSFSTSRKMWKFFKNMAVLQCISLAVTPAFRMQFWNTGAEGQTLMGVWGAIAVAFYLGGRVPAALLLVLMLAAALLCGACSSAVPEDYTQYVDPYIGTGDHGHVFMGANVPFGFVQLGPTSIPQTWDWCSGYNYADTTVIGFGHTHLSGTGIGDLFDITVMPVVGEVTYARGEENDPASGLWSYADRTREITKPGYYSVPLVRYGITAELTATERVGLHRYTFPASDAAAVVFDLENGGCWDKATETAFVSDGLRLSGYRYSTGWAKDQRVYFTAEFSKPVKNISYPDASETVPEEGDVTVKVRYARV